jgi:hypothetical protein
MAWWVEVFARLGREGRFDSEPGFPAALERFRGEVAAGGETPTWDAIADMMMQADIRGTEFDKVSSTKTLDMCWHSWLEATGRMQWT